MTGSDTPSSGSDTPSSGSDTPSSGSDTPSSGSETPGSRRLDPSGKRALFEAPIDVADDLLHGPDRSGKDALFSVGGPSSGTARITCSRCQERTRVSLTDLGLRVLRLSVWNPLRRHSRWITCPACGHRAWCHVSLTS